MEVLQKWLLHFELLIAGLVGAVIALPFQKDLTTKLSVAIFLLTGGACAYYLTGIVATHFGIPSASAGGVGFLLGAFGGSLISAVTRSIQNADIWSLIKKRFGGGA